MRIVIDLESAQSPQSRNRGIGRYSTALAKAMVRQKGPHEILIALNGSYGDTVDEVRRAFGGLLPQSSILTWHAAIPPRMPGSQAERAAFEAVRAAFFASLHPDVVHVASPFESGPYAFGTIGAIGTEPAPFRTAVTLYDLIPHIYSDIYLKWPGARTAYDGQLEHLKRADLWLAISESSRQEGIDAIALPADRVVNISSAADEHFVPGPVAPEDEASLRGRFGLQRPFVMYTGGFDHRKNIEGLIAAWAELPRELRGAHQLAIVCAVPPAGRDKLGKLGSDAGLAAGDVVFTGFVPEDDLVLLYRMCKLFVFPSLHEGFGLPALEAMSCGAPVIGSDNSSIPEVIGRVDALFDAKSSHAISAKIRQCLEDADFRAELAAFGLERATRFRWDESARTALDAIETLAPIVPVAPSAVVQHEQRPRLAYVSPFPPEHSGIASYSAELIPALAQHYDIDLISGQANVAGIDSASFRNVRTAEWFLDHGDEYDRVLYQFGNSHYHEYMLALLRQHPGTVMLHDFFLSGMEANRELVTEKRAVWSTALYESHGWHALIERCKANDLTEMILKFPANFEVLRDALGVIVHSPFSIQLAQEWYGPCAARDWKTIPHLRVPLPIRRDDARRELGFADDDFVVCSFGLLALTKMNDRLLRAWKASSLAADPRCRLVFVGENVSGGEYGRMLDKLAASAGGRVTITGWASDETFRQYLNASDVAVQLRTLSRGETSGTVLDAMNHGVPVIANANGTMAFLPRDAAIVLNEEFTDDELALALESMRGDPAKRRAMGDAARRIIETQHSPVHCAAQYHDAIEDFTAQAAFGRSAAAHRIGRGLPADSDVQVFASIARAIAHNQPAPAPARQLLVNATGCIQGDGPRAQLSPLVEAMLIAPTPGWRIEPVYLANDGCWRYARKCVLQRFGCDPQLLQDDIVELRPGDAWCLVGDEQMPADPVLQCLLPIRFEDRPDEPCDAATAWAHVAEAGKAV